MMLSQARVAKLADAKDLKSFSPQGECGFKSRPGHHLRDGQQITSVKDVPYVICAFDDCALNHKAQLCAY